MKKRFMAFVLILLMTFSSIATVYADDLRDKQNELKNSQDSINQLKNRLDSLKNSQKNVEQQMAELDKAMDDAHNLLDDVNGQINKINASIDKVQDELDKAVEEYDVQQELYASRVKSMYINGSVGYLEILLNSESLGDFISRVETVKTVVEFDKNVLTEMNQKQEEILAKKSELEEEKSNLSQLQAQYKQTVAELERADAQKQAYYNSIKDNVASVKKEVEAEEAEAKALEAEILRLQQEGNKENSGYSGYRTAIMKVSEIGYTPRVTSPFGNRFHPTLHVWKLHTGMDLGIRSGTPLYSMSEGKVIISTYSSSYGNYVAVSHADGIVSLYAHLSKRLVSVGTKVKAGQKIGLSGNTGYSTGPHLHFEIRKNGTAIDPAPYYILGK